MLAAGSDGGRWKRNKRNASEMLAAGSDGGRMLASGSADDIVTEAPPHTLLRKPCGDHEWSWTKARQGARVEFKSGDWHHKWLAHELRRHELVMSVEPQRDKLKTSKKSDHESDTNYYCWLTDPELASGGSGKGWAAIIGYSRINDKAGYTHGWVQFGKKCSDDRQKKLTVAVFLECFGFEPDSIENAVVLPTRHWRPKQKQPASGGLQEQSSAPAAGGWLPPPARAPAAACAPPAQPLRPLQMLSPELCRTIDNQLTRVIAAYGWPTWLTEGGGSGVPSRREHIFGVHRLGVCADDWWNCRWAALYHQLPKYQQVIARCYGDVTNEGQEGNCMEAVVGIAYASHTGCQELPEGSGLQWLSVPHAL